MFSRKRCSWINADELVIADGAAAELDITDGDASELYREDGSDV